MTITLPTRVSGGLLQDGPTSDSERQRLLDEIETLKKQNAALSHLALKATTPEPKTQPKSRPAFPATALRRQHQIVGLLTIKDFLESQ